jgi:hypothetical protein
MKLLVEKYMRTEEVKRYTRVLGVDEHADIREIQSAYRKLVLKYHPDVNRAAYSAERFRQIVEAYGSLLELVEKNDSTEWEDLKGRIKIDPVVRSISLSELEKRLKYSSSAKMRVNAAIALYVKLGTDSKNLLFTVLKDGDEEVQLTAVHLLGEICGPRDSIRLLQYLFSLRHLRVAKTVLQTTLKIVMSGFVGIIYEIVGRVYKKRSLQKIYSV